MAGIRVVRAEGDAASRGRQVGRGLGDLVERSLGFYHRYFERRGVESKQLQDLLAPYLVSVEANLPQEARFLKAMAEGAMVPVWELFAVNAFEELEPLLEPVEGQPLFLRRKEGYIDAKPAHPQAGPRSGPERCSSFTVAGPGYALIGHNEHWLAGDAGNVAVVVETPTDGGAALASPTVVCCLPAVGMNEHGGGQGIQSLTAADDGVGAPRVMVSRHALEAADRMDAVRRATMGPRAGGYGHVFGFAGGDCFSIETTRTRFGVLEGPGPHTNHYLDPGLAELGAAPSEGSLGRYERLLSLLEERRPTTPEGVMEVLRDHKSEPQAICLHPRLEEGDEASAVLFSMVGDLVNGRMWVAPGNPCSTIYEEIDVAGVR